jgi:hypothetical protein
MEMISNECHSQTIQRRRDDKTVSYESLSETPPDDALPWLDKSDADESKLTPHQLEWRRIGINILPNFLPSDLMQAYCERRAKVGHPHGWNSPTPYMQVEELRDLALYPPLMAHMRGLIGEDMLLHLALTGWVSTNRAWHQDDYLNPDHVNSWYAAVWMALDDIHPDSGPFEYIQGSHTWPLLRGHKVRSFMTEAELSDFASWPTVSEAFVVPAVEREIIKRGAPVKQFIARRGDVLIWHGRLMHRGSIAKVPDMMRKSLIVHFSGVNHREDMPNRDRDKNGQAYALHDIPLH